jgi:hypothetical protein
LREAAGELHHGNATQQVRVKDQRVLLSLEARKQIVALQFLRRDARRNA